MNISQITENGINFYDEDHAAAFDEFLKKMRKMDSYHLSMAYLLSLDSDLREHVNEVFDFEKDGIKPEGLHSGFMTGSSSRTIRLAFNLWNGKCDDGETYKDENGDERSLPSYYYTPDHIFCYSLYSKYYMEALKLRFPRVMN